LLLLQRGQREPHTVGEIAGHWLGLRVRRIEPVVLAYTQEK